MAEVREKPLNELLTHSLVDIYVGQNNNHWVLHEKLLTTRSTFFAKIFLSHKAKNADGTPQKIQTPTSRFSKTFGLPDEDEDAFGAFIGWLYGGALPYPHEESDLAKLFELYLMGEKWDIPGLASDTLDYVRQYYCNHDTYPGLRRVQYIYGNTEDGSPMRKLLVSSIARMLVLRRPEGKEPGIPVHWDKALRKNGQLAVDLIRSMQEWALEEQNIPDARRGEQDQVVAIREIKEKGLGDEIEKKAHREVDKALEREKDMPSMEQSASSLETADGDKTLVNGISGDELEQGTQDGFDSENDQVETPNGIAAH